MKIDSAELEAFKQTLPEDIRQESFRWLRHGFDIPKALFLIKKLNLIQHTISVSDWCKALGMDGESTAGKDIFAFSMMTGVSDDEAIKDNINLTYPLVILQHAWKRGNKREVSPLLIDGNKRLRKAFLNKIEKINAFVIPQEYEKLIQV